VESVDPIDRDRFRRHVVILVNAVAPGAGLVMLRWEWLGLTIAVMFASVAQLALWGNLLVPAAVPVGLTIGSTILAAAVWIAAQWLGANRLRAVLGPDARQELELLTERASQAVDDRRYSEASGLLKSALARNDEEPDLHRRMATLLTLTGQLQGARKSWENVLRLDQDRDRRREAVTAIEHLPAL